MGDTTKVEIRSSESMMRFLAVEVSAKKINAALEAIASVLNNKEKAVKHLTSLRPASRTTWAVELQIPVNFILSEGEQLKVREVLQKAGWTIRFLRDNTIALKSIKAYDWEPYIQVD